MNTHVTLAYISTDETASRFTELDCVRLKRDVQSTDGRQLPAGSLGAVLVTWDFGATYEVELTAPFSATAIVRAGDLEHEPNRA